MVSLEYIFIFSILLKMNCIILPTQFGFESVEFTRNTMKCSVTWRLFGIYI